MAFAIFLIAAIKKLVEFLCDLRVREDRKAAIRGRTYQWSANYIRSRLGISA